MARIIVRVAAVSVAVTVWSCATLSPETLTALREEAASGSTSAQIELGDRYRSGSGVTKDAVTALTWYRAAASGGVADALSRYFCDGSSDSLEVPRLEDIFTFDLVSASAEGIVPPAIKREVKPSYTRSAMDADVQGSVTMEIVILENGLVGGVAIETPLAARSDYGLNIQALCAASQWQFEAAKKDGVSIATKGVLTLDFRLH